MQNRKSYHRQIHRFIVIWSVLSVLLPSIALATPLGTITPQQSQENLMRLQEQNAMLNTLHMAEGELFLLQHRTILVRRFAQNISDHIYGQWEKPVGYRPFTCIVEIELREDGRLAGKPEILQSTGNHPDDGSVIKAVERAAPYTPPEGLPYQTYRIVRIRFTG